VPRRRTGFHIKSAGPRISCGGLGGLLGSVWLFLLCPLRTPIKAIIQRLAAAEAGLDGVPMGDFVFTHFPAEEHDFAVDLTGKIKQADVEVFDLNADGVDFLDGIFGTLDMGIQFGALTADFGDIDVHSATHEDALAEALQLFVDDFGGMSGIDAAFQQRFQDGNQSLRFIESKKLHLTLPSLSAYD